MKKLFTYFSLLFILFTAIGHHSFAQGDINAMEYFIDTDPGVGAATVVPITPGANITESFTISTSLLPVGFHTVYFRTQDLGGQWSMLEARPFYISASSLTAQADIIDIEYFIDTDPGYGAATSLGPFATTNLTTNQIINTSTLLAGFHVLYVRALDSDGVWGNLESRSFFVSQSNLNTTATIQEVRYYIDIDPGYGNGTLIPITTGTNINVSTTITTSSLLAGHHVLYIRSLDSDGVWSETESRSFYVDAYATGLLTAVEYFYDTDPGYGNASTVAIAPAAATIDQIVNLPTSALSAGTHELGIRMVNENGSIGITDYYTFDLCNTAIAGFTPDVVCIGSSTSFIDSSTGVLTGDIFSWDFDGDAVEDSNITGNQSFSFATSGTFNATLTIDRAGCISTFTIPVQVEPIPVSDAGPNQSICNTAATLAGNTPAVNETGIWSILSGTATITNPSSPTTTITGISTSSVELIWTLTNTLAGCSNQNNVLVSANLPITASTQAISVDIGQTININVQSTATINSGDVLTTTLTVNPTQGDAIVLTNGTIDFTPYNNATDNDSFTFRIANQCNNFDENIVNISIINDPPIIDNTSFTIPADVKEVSFDLTSLISDPNNNLDFASLRIISQPISGATATIDENGVLSLDYRGVTFSGNDQLEIEICDLVGVCTVQIILIPNVEVGGENPPIKVFNALSPNGDGYHDFLEIENIEFYPQNTVIILNRWGNEVAKYQGYNNQDVVFKSTTLPAGTYYYHILSGVEAVDPVTGFFLLKYDK